MPVTSPALQRVLRLIGERDHRPNFPIHLVAKDLHYLSTTARELGATMPIIETEALFRASPTGDLDISGIAASYRAS